MSDEKDVKVNRVLTIYSRLVQGEFVNKKEMSKLFNVNERTIQRDLDDIRSYFSDNRESMGFKDVIYQRDKKGYGLENRDDVLTREDVLVIIKILLESRSLCSNELNHITNSILGQVNYEQRKHIKDIIGNELLHYVPLKHNEQLLEKIWSISELLRNNEVIEMIYKKTDGEEVNRIVKPVSIIFSEYYFYLIAYYNDFTSPTVFRVDRIKSYKKKGEKFRIPESERFKDGEFRRRIQFMYPGKLIKIRFEFTGISIEPILDRLPTAEIIEVLDNKFVVEAEVYGKGIIMWILSQGKNIKVISPEDFCNDIINAINQMREVY